MKAMRLALAAAAVWVGLAALAPADDKADKDEADVKKKIVGRWEAVEGKGLPKGAVMDFKKDGKVTITAKVNEKDINVDGTYKVKGKSFTLTMKGKDKQGKEKERTQTIKITKITDKALEVEDSKGEALTFKKAKKED
jgi:uncharacterized protein (TIGR03066 family)